MPYVIKKKTWLTVRIFKEIKQITESNVIISIPPSQKQIQESETKMFIFKWALGKNVSGQNGVGSGIASQGPENECHFTMFYICSVVLLPRDFVFIIRKFWVYFGKS